MTSRGILLATASVVPTTRKPVVVKRATTGSDSSRRAIGRIPWDVAPVTTPGPTGSSCWARGPPSAWASRGWTARRRCSSASGRTPSSGSSAAEWTPTLDDVTVVASALVGGVIGLLAGAYPAIRAARVEPIAALRGGGA